MGKNKNKKVPGEEGGAPGGLTLGSFLDLPPKGPLSNTTSSSPLQSAEAFPDLFPSLPPKGPAPAPAAAARVAWGGAAESKAPSWAKTPLCAGVSAPAAAPPANAGPVVQPKAECPYTVNGSKKGGFPLQIETRKCGKKVTVVRNVTGDVSVLLKDIKNAVGAGGVVRDNDVEVQGEHVARIEAMLAKKGCLKGVSHQSIASAQPKAAPKAAAKTNTKLDKKAQELKQKGR